MNALGRGLALVVGLRHTLTYARVGRQNPMGLKYDVGRSCVGRNASDDGGGLVLDLESSESESEAISIRNSWT
jgi:hypothetical protein